MKKFNNLKLSSQFYFCPYALSFDIYQGCPHSCRYCFSLTQFFANASFLDKVFGKVQGHIQLNVIEKYLRNEYGHGHGFNRMIQFLFNVRQPLHIGGMFDPFPKGEEEIHGIGKQTLELLNKYHYPAIFSTKNPPVEYKELFGKGNYVLQVTLTTLDDELARKLEPRAPLPSERLKAMKELRPHVKKLIVRLQPFIPSIFENESLDNYMGAIKEAGADAVTVEFLKLSVFQTSRVKMQWKELGKVLGRDVLTELNTLGETRGADKEYPYTYKLKIMKNIKELAHKHNLQFFSAENQTRALGDGYACCGILEGEIPDMDSKLSCYNKLLFKAKEKGTIGFEDLEIKPYMELQHVADMWNTQDRRYRIQHIDYTIKDYMEEAWKNPKSVNPSIFFKGLKPIKEGNKLKYKWVGLDAIS